MLSVIIPAYNAANTLGEQLDALRVQTYSGDWEIVVVNNRSSDDTVDVVRGYQHLMPHLRLIDAPEKQSRSYAYNVGAQAARGEAIIFCDADDVTAPNWLAALAEALKKHRVVTGALEVEMLNRSAPWRPFPFNGANHRVLDFLPIANTCNLAISREAFEAVGGFSEDFFSGGDIDLLWRLQLKGYTIHDAPAAIVHYRYRDNLRDLWLQTATYAEIHAKLYKRFAPYGMPRSSVRKALLEYKHLFKRGLRIILLGVEPREREIWVWRAAARWGRLRGSLRYRTLYL